MSLPTIADGFSGYSEEMLFVDPLHALVIGFESGNLVAGDPTTFATRRTLSLTADAGASWQARAAANQRRLLHVPPRRSDDGLAVSTNAVLRTQDNGATWQPVPMPLGVFALTGFRAFGAQRLVLGR